MKLKYNFHDKLVLEIEQRRFSTYGPQAINMALGREPCNIKYIL